MGKKFSLSAYLSKNRNTRSSGRKTEYQIELRYYFDGKKTSFPFKPPIYASSSDIKNSTLIPSHPDFHRYYSEFQRIQSTAEEIIAGGNMPTTDFVRMRLDEISINKSRPKKKPDKSFWKMYDAYFKYKEGETSRGNYKTLLTLKNHLKDFERFKSKKHANFKIDWKYFSSRLFFDEYKNYIRSEKRHTDDYLKKQYDRFKSFVNWCKNYKDYQIGLKWYDQTRKILGKRNVQKTYLTTEEIHKLYTEKERFEYINTNPAPKRRWEIVNSTHVDGFELKEWDKLKERNITIIDRAVKSAGKSKVSSYELCADIMLLLCGIGCRWSDLIKLKGEHVIIKRPLPSQIRFIQNKTQDVVTLPDVKGSFPNEIIRKYYKGNASDSFLFPQITQQFFNRTIKHVLKELNIERKVTIERRIDGWPIIKDIPIHDIASSHMGRRTLVNLLKDNDMDMTAIMTFSGHRDVRSIQSYYTTTEKDEQEYSDAILKVTNSQLSMEVNSLIQEFKNLDLEKLKELKRLSTKSVQKLKAIK